jgi:hypothetical protein
VDVDHVTKAQGKFKKNDECIVQMHFFVQLGTKTKVLMPAREYQGLASETQSQI